MCFAVSRGSTSLFHVLPVVSLLLAACSAEPFVTADHPPLPLVTYHGGKIIHEPRIVTVTFASDGEVDVWRAFDDELTSSSYWAELTSEYCDESGTCIGPGSGGIYATLPDDPLTITHQDFESQILLPRLADGTLPPPTPDMIYVFYFPHDAQLGGASAGGIHASTMITDPATGTILDPNPVRYAISKDGVASAAHEIVETVTNPDPVMANSLAWVMTDEAFVDYYHGGEVVDLCQVVHGPLHLLPSWQGFMLPRGWSNRSALAGGDPCVPALEGMVYFNAAPDVRTVHLAVGESATVELTAFSDVPHDGEWQLSANGTTHLGVSAVSPAQADNGTRATVTVTLLQPLPEFSLVKSFAVASSAEISYEWPIAVAAK